MRHARPPLFDRAVDFAAVASAGVVGGLWLDRAPLSTDADAARMLGGVTGPGAPLLDVLFAALVRPCAFAWRLFAARALTIAAWTLLGAMLAKRAHAAVIAAGPASFRDAKMPALLRWVVVALVLACAPVVHTFHLGGALLSLAMLVAAEEADDDDAPLVATCFALLASMQGAPFALAAMLGGAQRIDSARRTTSFLRLLAPAFALALRALPLGERLHPLAFLESLPATPAPPLPVDSVVIALGGAGIVLAILEGAMVRVRPATEALALVVVLPLVALEREAWLSLDPSAARALVVVALTRPIAAAAAASFTLAGRDTLARYRRVFLGVAWLAFVARAGTDLLCRARETFAAADAARGVFADIPARAVVMVDGDEPFARFVVARGVSVIHEDVTILRWRRERASRLAAELDRDAALQPMARDLMLRDHGDARTLFDLAKARPVRTTAASVFTADTASRLVPAGFLLRPLDEAREPASSARTPTFDEAGIEATLEMLRAGGDRGSTIEAHRMLCVDAGLFATTSRRELASRYCRVMAPAAAVVRCSICPGELRVSAQDR